MHVISAAFVTSAVQPSQYPPPNLPEIAFAGRSNVGKSTLINRLVNRRRLVKTSATPGRTQLINFFDINNAFTLVDLPGYGYARVPERVRRQWGPMIERYLDHRPTLCGVVLILDIRRRPGDQELSFLRWLADREIAAVLVLTKADKVSKNRQGKQRRVVAADLAVSEGQLLPFSAKSRQGLPQIWQAIENLLPPAAGS
jgi:GTP-binding protein